MNPEILRSIFSQPEDLVVGYSGATIGSQCACWEMASLTALSCRIIGYVFSGTRIWRVYGQNRGGLVYRNGEQ